jgi:hypothetical protein
MTRFLVAMMSILLPAVTLAAGSSGPRGLRTVHIEAAWFVMVTGTTPFLNPDLCGSADGVLIRKEDAWYTDTLAAVMTAKAAGLPVQFWVSGCANTPWGYSMPVVYSVSIDP